jgi:hypothetical protein
MLSVFIIFFVSNSFADDTKTNLAIEYLELTKTKQGFETTINTYVNQLNAKNAQLDKNQLRAFFDLYMGWDVLKDPAIRIISDSYSESELKGINEFFKSENGKALADKSPEISMEIARLISGNLNKVFAEMRKNSDVKSEK